MKQVQVIGNLGNEPKIIVATNGKELMQFSLAESRKGAETTWFSVVANKQESILPYMSKGRQIFVQGSFEVKDYKGALDFSIFADRIQLLGSKEERPEQIAVDTAQQPAQTETADEGLTF